MCYSKSAFSRFLALVCCTIALLIAMSSCSSSNSAEKTTLNLPGENTFSVETENVPSVEPVKPEPMQTEFERKVQAEKNTRGLTLDSLLRRPYDYVDGKLYRFGGKITYMDRGQAETVGYLEYNMGGLDRSVLKFSYPGWMDALEEDKLVIWGTITGMSGDYLTVDVDFYELGGYYRLAGFPKEVWDLILGGYHHEKANIELTRETIYGIPYSVTEYQLIDATPPLILSDAMRQHHGGTGAEAYCMVVNITGEDSPYYILFDYVGNMSVCTLSSDVYFTKIEDPSMVDYNENSTVPAPDSVTNPQSSHEPPSSNTNGFPPAFTPIEGYSDYLGEYIDEYGRVLEVGVGTDGEINYFIDIYANQTDAANHASPLLTASHGTLEYRNGYMIIAFKDSSGNALYFERDNWIEDNYTLYVHGDSYVGGCDVESYLDTTFYMTVQGIDPMT